jgi:hypothetical protein
MQIRAATETDLRQWFDGKVPATMRAIVAEHEGQLLGIAGIAMCEDHAQAFSGYRPGMRGWPVTMGRMAVVFASMLERAGVPVIAICSETEPTAPALLARLGFDQQDERKWRYG